MDYFPKSKIMFDFQVGVDKHAHVSKFHFKTNCLLTNLSDIVNIRKVKISCFLDVSILVE